MAETIEQKLDNKITGALVILAGGFFELMQMEGVRVNAMAADVFPVPAGPAKMR